MALFTYFFAYRGTSAVGQINAPTPKSAVTKWTKSFDYAGTLGMKKPEGEVLLRAFSEQQPLPVKRSKNVWGMAANADGTLALLHVVKTDEKE